MELIAFQPVVDSIEKMMTSPFPQYPNEYLENVVIRSPVNPNVAVQAGSKQEKTLMIRMMAKLLQKSKPIEGPTIPVLSVATAKLALNQKVQAFQTWVVGLFLRSASVTRWMPPVSIESFRSQDHFFAY